MDRHYYYRLLGLTCEASQSQIKKAYETRMSKLNSPDYADDPEYRRKKKEQATMAYRVLTGSAPVPTRGQKKNRFERFKDALESSEEWDNDCDVCVDEEDKPSFKERFESTIKQLPKKRKTTVTFSPNKAAVIPLFVIGFAILTVIGTIFAMIAEDGVSDFSEYDSMETEISYIDYYEELDFSQQVNYSAKVDWDEGADEYGTSDTYYVTRDILTVLGVNDADEFFWYITGDEYYYQEQDDLTCADVLIDWLGAPVFDEVAGARNEYTQERILSHADYLEYLDDCIWNSF